MITAIAWEHLNESSQARNWSEEPRARSQEERVRRKEEQGRSQNNCFYKYEMLPIAWDSETDFLNKIGREYAKIIAETRFLGLGAHGASETRFLNKIRREDARIIAETRFLGQPGFGGFYSVGS